jgi:hypothetical protein
MYYLILACTVWLSCAIATAFTKDIQALEYAFTTTVCIWIVWVATAKE